MLDNFTIFSRGGVKLFSWSAIPLKGSPINTLVSDVLLEERSGLQTFNYTSGSTKYTLRWTFHNELDIVFVAVYQSILQLAYVEDLLAKVKEVFASNYKPSTIDYPEFVDEFLRLQALHEKKADAAKAGVTKSPTASKGQSAPGKKGKGQDSVKGKPEALAAADAEKADDGGAEEGGNGGESSPGAFDVSKLKRRTSRAASIAGGSSPKNVPRKVDSKGKKMRVWDGGEPGDQQLDFSKGKPEDSVGGEDMGPLVTGKSMMEDDDDDDNYEEDEDEDEDEEDEGTGGGSKKRGWMANMLRGVSGKTVLDQQDIDPMLETLKSRLMSKNVAAEIADKLCESVASRLLGTKLGSFQRVSTTVHTAMHHALTRILTPRRNVDIMQDIIAAKQNNKVYSIVFIGVNGVGKSTNLAKVAYWLLQHDMKVMIAACDTFRAGAVEQLKTHCRRLEATTGVNVPLFERGYEKDPAAVAMEGMRAAKKAGCDVLLVDTAGRMQDNKPLMEALSKLIDVNNPDLCLFVGEALVGNDAVDQLKKFNQWLLDLSTKTPPHLIDGIVLTKFDTVDEKVGAALSMVYESGAPVMFVGCGQTYTDLRKLNVKQITNGLLKA